MKMTLKSSYEDDHTKEQNFLSKMCLVESLVVHTPNVIEPSLIKKLAMKKTLKIYFGRRPSSFYQVITKGTGPRLIHA